MEHTARAGLGAIDRIVMVLAWLVSCAAVYALGFYTGSHTQDHVRGDEERVVRLPVVDAPPPSGQRSKAADDLTFWTALEPGGQRAKPGEGIPAARASAAAPAPPVAKPEPPPSKPKPAARAASTATPTRAMRATAPKAATTAAATRSAPAKPATPKTAAASPSTSRTVPARSSAPATRSAQPSPAAVPAKYVTPARPSGQTAKEPRAPEARRPPRPAPERPAVTRSAVDPE
jgi:hypothetical protein